MYIYICVCVCACVFFFYTLSPITRTAHVVMPFAPTHQRQPHRFWRRSPHQSCVESQCKVPPNIYYCMASLAISVSLYSLPLTSYLLSPPRRHCVCIRNAWSAGKLRTFYFSFENDWWALLASVYSCLDVLVPALPSCLLSCLPACLPLCLSSVCLLVLSTR